MFIQAQIVSLIATVINVVGIQLKDRKSILLSLVLGNFFVALSMLLLNAYSGFIIQLIFVTQTLINYVYEIKNKKLPKALIISYIIVAVIAEALVFKSFIDILPLICAVLYTITVIQSKEKNIRILNLCGVTLWIPYSIYIKLYVGAIACLLIAISNIISIVRYDILKKDKKIMTQKNAKGTVPSGLSTIVSREK